MSRPPVTGTKNSLENVSNVGLVNSDNTVSGLLKSDTVTMFASEAKNPATKKAKSALNPRRDERSICSRLTREFDFSLAKKYSPPLEKDFNFSQK